MYKSLTTVSCFFSFSWNYNDLAIHQISSLAQLNNNTPQCGESVSLFIFFFFSKLPVDFVVPAVKITAIAKSTEFHSRNFGSFVACASMNFHELLYIECSMVSLGCILFVLLDTDFANGQEPDRIICIITFLVFETVHYTNTSSAKTKLTRWNIV